MINQLKLLTLIAVVIFSLPFYAQDTRQAVELFPLNEVKLLESPFLEAQNTDMKYILAMEPDRLLAPYLREAGLTPKAPSYTNWESTGLDGHIGGHYLSALSMLYAASGNEEIKRRIDYMVDELKRCQDAVGTGFIGGTPGSIPMWNEIKADTIHAARFSLNGKWVPLYNIHKTYAGLRDAYLFAHNKKAKDMLIKLTDWMISITAELSDERMQYMLRSEHGGLNETFADVYALTQDKKYLELAERFSHQAVLQPLLQKEDKLTGMHANTQIPKIIGYKRIADLSGNKAWDEASDFFWETVVKNRTISIGGNSVREHFHAIDNFNPMVTSVEGPETCNTYNMLRLSNMLYHSSLDTKYLDYYERALYNHILSSQEPDKGGFVYFTSMRPGHYRVYSQPETSMWCCVGSGLENHTKYGELIYAHTDKALLVNLFIPSKVNWKEKGIVLSQETKFPDENRIKLSLEEVKEKKFTLQIRCPEWVDDSRQIVVMINGKPVTTPIPDKGYLSFERKWKKGDVIALELPMKLKLEQLPDKSSYYSFLYGPVVLATKTGTEDLKGLYADDSRSGHIAHGRQIPLQETPFMVGEADQLVSHVKKNGAVLSFTYTGDVYPDSFRNLELIPFFRLHNARYAVYFHQVTASELQAVKDEITRKEKEAIELSDRTLDLIYPGEQQPESDHFIQYGKSNTGSENERHFRAARDWFSYELKVAEGEEATEIRLVWHKNDRKPQTALTIDETVITSSPNIKELDEHFLSVSYELPAPLTQGSHTIKFVTIKEEKTTNRIFEVRLIK